MNSAVAGRFLATRDKWGLPMRTVVQLREVLRGGAALLQTPIPERGRAHTALTHPELYNATEDLRWTHDTAAQELARARCRRLLLPFCAACERPSLAFPDGVAPPEEHERLENRGGDGGAPLTPCLCTHNVSVEAPETRRIDRYR